MKKIYRRKNTEMGLSVHVLAVVYSLGIAPALMAGLIGSVLNWQTVLLLGVLFYSSLYGISWFQDKEKEEELENSVSDTAEFNYQKGYQNGVEYTLLSREYEDKDIHFTDSGKPYIPLSKSEDGNTSKKKVN